MSDGIKEEDDSDIENESEMSDNIAAYFCSYCKVKHFQTHAGL